MVAPDGVTRPFRVIDAGDEPATSVGVTTVLVERIRLALAGLDIVERPAGLADDAEAIRTELEQLVGSAGESYEARKLTTWGAVATARSELKTVELRRGRSEEPTLNAGAVAAVERELRAVEEAQFKAEKKLSSPSAFRKLVDSKRELQRVLRTYSFGSVEEFHAAVEARGAGGSADTDSLEKAHEAVRRAEAAWERFLVAPPSGLPHTTEADALRARCYRVLGRVVGDDDLGAALHDLIDRDRADRAARQLLLSTLNQIGVDPGDDASQAARSWLDRTQISSVSTRSERVRAPPGSSPAMRCLCVTPSAPRRDR